MAGRRSARKHLAIEVGCTDWYIYPDVEPDAKLPAIQAAKVRRAELRTKGAAATPVAEPRRGVWVKRPMTA